MQQILIERLLQDAAGAAVDAASRRPAPRSRRSCSSSSRTRARSARPTAPTAIMPSIVGRGFRRPARRIAGVAGVAGGDRDEHAAADGVADGIVDDRRRTAAGAADAHVDDLGAVVGRVADAARDDVVGAGDWAVEDEVPDLVDHLHRHDAHVVGHAGDADAVVGQLADRAADVRAVPVEIERAASSSQMKSRGETNFASPELGRDRERDIDEAERRVKTGPPAVEAEREAASCSGWSTCGTRRRCRGRRR